MNTEHESTGGDVTGRVLSDFETTEARSIRRILDCCRDQVGTGTSESHARGIASRPHGINIPFRAGPANERVCIVADGCTGRRNGTHPVGPRSVDKRHCRDHPTDIDLGQCGAAIVLPLGQISGLGGDPLYGLVDRTCTSGRDGDRLEGGPTLGVGFVSMSGVGEVTNCGRTAEVR